MLIQRLPRSPFPHKREPRAQSSGAPALGTRVRGHDARKPRFRLAGLISIGLHAVLLTGLLQWFRHAPPSGDDQQASGAVELVMLEQQGSGVPAAPHEPAPAIAAPAAPAPPEPPASPPPPDVATADEALPLPPIPPPVAPPVVSPRVPPVMPSQPTPPVRRAQEGPQIKLGGNSDVDAIVIGGPRVIPASVDAKFRNREPVYPREAVLRAEQGAVILLIHVSPQGLPFDVDIAESSGFTLLDRAARDAVLGWHFVPAVQDGQPIPLEMKLRVLFNLE